ncbi:MAG: LPS assembly lipoprotein LptE [Rhodospirillaceae bacterium]
MRGLIGRAAMLPGLVLLLGACGFRPMVGAHSAGSESLADVTIASIEDRSGQQLRNALIDRFYRSGRPAAPTYTLEVKLNAGDAAQVVQKDSTPTQSQWTVTADYRLLHNATGKAVFQGSSRALAAYNLTNYQYSSYVAQQSALDRSIGSLADEITGRIALYVQRDPDQKLTFVPAPPPSKP